MSAAGAHARRDGLLLAASAVLGMVLMNSALAPAFVRLLEAPISLGLAPVVLTKTAHHWVNDGLMALFFLLVGIEIRHEWQHGTLSTNRARVLPLGAALGGMLVPALVFTLFNHGQPQAMAGWAIPAATDIAFALGLMAIAAPRTAPALLAFLTAVAVLDDLGAIVVIAVFYTAQLSPAMLLGAALTLAVLLGLARAQVQRGLPYLLAGALLWLLVLKSGVHATLAGVITGLVLPQAVAARTQRVLAPAVSWGVLPLFGAMNAGVPLAGLSAALLLQPVTLGVAAGLLLGKPLGILGGLWVASRVGGGWPAGQGLRSFVPVACFCGVGFTMALFIAALAFEAGSPLADAAKLGVLLGTAGAFVLGAVLARALPSTH